jgi:hypothetical protein
MTYEYLTDDEKAAVKQAAIRSLEYQMYSLEVDKLAENAKTSPNAEMIAALTASISEKQSQISAVKA